MNTLSSLAEIADQLYSIMDLGQDGDDEYPESYWQSEDGVKKVILRAFGSSDCGNFAVVLHEMTGYPIYNLIGPDACPVHSFVMTPCGQALDVYGLSEIRGVAKRYGFRGDEPKIVMVDPEYACGVTLDDEIDDEGQCPERTLITQVIDQIPWPPFSQPGFRGPEGIRNQSYIHGVPVIDLIDRWIKSTRGYGQDGFEDLMVLPAIQLALLRHDFPVKIFERLVKITPSIYTQIHAFEIDGRIVGLDGERSWEDQARSLCSTWIGEMGPATQSSLSIPEDWSSVEDIVDKKINMGTFSFRDIAVVRKFLGPVEADLLSLQMDRGTYFAPSAPRNPHRL